MNAALRTMPASPLHAQIREAMRRAILDGTDREHAQLASEGELMGAFDVSRHRLHLQRAPATTTRLKGAS